MLQPTSITLDPGERARFSAQFTPYMILTHLKVDVVITDERVIVRRPNTLFGLIPLGYNEQTSPIRHISQFSAGESFSSMRLGLGIFCALSGLAWLVGGILPTGGGGLTALMGLVALGVAVYLIASAHEIGLVFRNHGAGTLAAGASRSERAQVEAARSSIVRLFFSHAEPSAPDAGNARTVAAPAAASPTPAAAHAAATDPTTAAAELSRLAEHHPQVRPLVAAHPNAYPGLLEWLAALGDPDVNRALADRRANSNA